MSHANTTTLFDPLNPAHHEDAARRLGEARQHCPVSFPHPGMAFVSNNADVRAAMKDPARLSNRGNFALEGANAALPVLPITMTDPPEHTELRARLRDWFAPARLREEEPRVLEIVAETLARLPDAGEIELYSAFILRVPASVVFGFLGLPRDDWDRIQVWSDAFVARLPEPTDDLPEFHALWQYLSDHVAAAAETSPSGSGVIDGLAHPRGDQRAMSTPEVVTHVLQLVAAATDTTRSAVTNVVHSLLEDPGAWKRVCDDRKLVPIAVEESLRHDSPLQFVLRTANEDIQIGECQIDKDSKVVLSLQSANWDEAAWGSDAASFSLDRKHAAGHVAFGTGIHVCLGAPLARLQARLMLEGLLDRYPAMRLAEGYAWEKVAGTMIRRPQTLDVVLR